jgi:amino acid permease
MKKATVWSIIITSFYYMSIGMVGYAAFGDAAPGNLLTGFGFFEPYWLIIIANLAIVIHLLGAYQVRSLCAYTPPPPFFSHLQFAVS